MEKEIEKAKNKENNGNDSGSQLDLFYNKKLQKIKKELQDWISKVNFFEVTGITNREIKHSNFLGYLCDANESHRLEDLFIKEFVRLVVNEKNQNIDPTIIKNHKDKLGATGFKSFSVLRESNNLDILMVSEDEKIIITIENKIWSKESVDNSNNKAISQTERYKKELEKLYPDSINIMIYLTPEGSLPKDEEWYVASYHQVKDVLSEILKIKTMDEKIKLILNDYVDLIRRRIVKDKELEEKCIKIYNENQEIFDLIFDNKPDKEKILTEIILKHLENKKDVLNINFDRKFSRKSWIRFTTAASEEKFPQRKDSAEGHFKNGHKVMYEIGLEGGVKLIKCQTLMDNAAKSDAVKRIGSKNIINQKKYNKIDPFIESDVEDLLKKIDQSIKDLLKNENGFFARD